MALLFGRHALQPVISGDEQEAEETIELDQDESQIDKTIDSIAMR